VDMLPPADRAVEGSSGEIWEIGLSYHLWHDRRLGRKPGPHRILQALKAIDAARSTVVASFVKSLVGCDCAIIIADAASTARAFPFIPFSHMQKAKKQRRKPTTPKQIRSTSKAAPSTATGLWNILKGER